MDNTLTNPRFSHYVTHQAFLDEHHKKILTVLDEISQLSKNRKLFEGLVLSEEMQQKLSNALNDLAEHFAQEELAMFRILYPYLESHRAAHTETMKQLLKLTQKLTGGIVSDSLEVLLKHIDFFDVQLAEFCKNKAIELH